MGSDHITPWQIDLEKSRNSGRFVFLGLQNHCGMGLQPPNLKTLDPWKKIYDKPRQHMKKQRHYFANKGSYSQCYSFSSNHVEMWELGHKEGWVLNNWPFWIVVLEKTLESYLDSKEIKSVNSKGNQSRYEELTHFKRLILEGWHAPCKMYGQRQPLLQYFVIIFHRKSKNCFSCFKSCHPC